MAKYPWTCGVRRGRKMTKREATSEFHESYPRKLFVRRGRIDSPMRDQAWNDYTDMLCKEGRITARQYDTWRSPWK